MLWSKDVPTFGRVYYPPGASTQLTDLIEEVGDYFGHGVTLKPGDTVFDVGANIGMFALRAAHFAGGPLNFYCFEPIPELFEVLEKNFENPLFAEKPHLFPVGLTEAGGPSEAEFYYFKRLPCDSTAHIEEKRGEFQSFFKSKVGRLSGLVDTSVGRFVFERAIGATSMTCPLSTIEKVVEDEKVERIDLLKVDVEGAELQVLKGVGDKAWARVQQVVLEGHDIDGRLDEIKGLLEKAGISNIHVEVPELAIERGLNNFVLVATR